MIQKDIYSALIGTPGVQMLVGSRVYPAKLPEKITLPAVAYQMSLDTAVNSLSGDSGLDIFRLEVACWATSYAGAQDVAKAVREALIDAPGFNLLTESQDDDQDLDTMNYAVILVFSVWSEFDATAKSFLLLEDGNRFITEGP
jgi:hypothetical protein